MTLLDMMRRYPRETKMTASELADTLIQRFADDPYAVGKLADVLIALLAARPELLANPDAFIERFADMEDSQ